METNKYINIIICMVIGVVLLTTLAVPVMTLHGSRQETYDNATGYIEGYKNDYAFVTSMDSVEFSADSEHLGQFTLNGETYTLSEIVENDYILPVFLCDAGFIYVKTYPDYIIWSLYFYSENIADSSQFISNHIMRFGNLRQSATDPSFYINLSISNGQMVLDFSDGGGAITYHIESPVRLFSYGYDPDGSYIARGGHYLYPISWKDDDIRWVAYYVPGSAYQNGTTVAWNPNITNPVTNFQTKSMGGGVVQLDGNMTVTYQLNGETITSDSMSPQYYIVPTEVLGDRIQGVDNPSIIAIVAVIPLIIAVSLVIWLSRSIFSREE